MFKWFLLVYVLGLVGGCILWSNKDSVLTKLKTLLHL